ncbi:uncharacterized protein LOC131328729 [Rhododendron vialii]|uniref:uncharacterized protein LOC131328729 n=1 Tax=Rhododendron vialii TaxID=182163 RepID=UPI00265DBA97|nr:uncharacterized protein LOC131328729 [Rhododendron vialii]
MATSVSVCPDDAVGGLDDEYSRPENGKHSGRRKPKSNEKKKQPQRGMGVAQLERLRLQERWKKISTHHNPLLLQPHNINPHTNNHYFVPASFPDPTSFVSSYGDGVGVNQGFLLPKLGKDGFSGQVGPGQLQVEPYGFGNSNSGFGAGNVARETSNELSSMPNVNCYNGQCDLCHKKKRIVDGENLGFNGMRDKYAGCRFLGFNLGNKEKLDQETEVLAVHRKGISSGGGHGSVLMEYEFFPAEKSGCRGATSTCCKAVEFGLLLPPEEDSVAVRRGVDGGDQGDSFLATRNDSTARFGASNSVDLSLKLSY